MHDFQIPKRIGKWKYRSVQVHLQFCLRGFKTGGGLGRTLGKYYQLNHHQNSTIAHRSARIKLFWYDLVKKLVRKNTFFHVIIVEGFAKIGPSWYFWHAKYPFLPSPFGSIITFLVTVVTRWHHTLYFPVIIFCIRQV